MTDIEQKFLRHIQDAQKILVFAHIRADWDAISSVLMTTALLRNQYPDKQIFGAIEKASINNGEFLPYYDTLLTNNAVDIVEEKKPDLILIVDCPEITRISFDTGRLKTFLSTTKTPIIGIDHHELSTIYPPTLLINHRYSSATEEIYTFFVKTLNFPETPQILQLLAAGIIGDTRCFMFLKDSARQTFEYAAYLSENGVDLGEINRQENRYTKQHVLILEEFLKNLNILDDVTYSYISDSFHAAHPEMPRDLYSESKEIFSMNFLRQVSDNSILFTFYPENIGYKGSIRGVNEEYDMTVFAQFLNGGGHKSACGFKLTEQKKDIDALSFILEVIEAHKSEARQDLARK